MISLKRSARHSLPNDAVITTAHLFSLPALWQHAVRDWAVKIRVFILRISSDNRHEMELEGAARFNRDYQANLTLVSGKITRLILCEVVARTVQ